LQADRKENEAEKVQVEASTIQLDTYKDAKREEK
jgi:hypothetical protein